MKIKVNEIFYSIQGEGTLAGLPCIFIRLSGCPLRCKWCDTKYAWDIDSGRDYTIDEIVAEAQNVKTNFVVITGGEPMINENLSALCTALKQNKKHITIETAGINYLPALPIDLMSISPKLSNSIPPQPKIASTHKHNYLNIPALQKLVKNYPCQLKFVIEAESDIDEIYSILKDIPPINPEKLMLMPAAASRTQYLKNAPIIAQLCKKHNFRFSPRLQTILFDNQPGT